ncbi:hypothetical protein V8V75_20320, partial [Peribacillus frigoritolerans]|uniref:hypothetical protein n=1 Tax=Peribacillus frigoritolerans TaxID=450367 RepID=UPI003007F735
DIYSEPSLKLVYPLSFFPVILIGWKKYATLQPKYCLAETPQALSRGGLADSRRKGSGFLNQLERFLEKTVGWSIPNQV